MIAVIVAKFVVGVLLLFVGISQVLESPCQFICLKNVVMNISNISIYICTYTCKYIFNLANGFYFCLSRTILFNAIKAIKLFQRRKQRICFLELYFYNLLAFLSLNHITLVVCIFQK